MVRYFLSLLFLLVLTLEVKAVRNILHINSYHSGFTWTDGITDGINETVSKRPDINLYVEFEDSKRYTDSTNIALFKKYILKKYNRQKIDLIITSDNSALDFVIENQLADKWNAPVVFCGISNYEDYDISNKNYFGILETDDWLPVILAISKIHNNNLDNFYFISENSSTGKIRDTFLKKSFEEADLKTKLVFLNNFTVESLLKEIESIRGNSIIYYHGVGVDWYGHPIVPENLGIELAQQARVPVYSSYPSIIGKGALGGFVRSGKIHGIQTAELALQLLDGVDKNSIPKISVQKGEFLFDYSRIKKYNLDFKKFPVNSTFISKPPKILEVYKREVFLSLLFILILLVIIAFLISSFVKRIRAEKKYNESETRFKEFAELLPQIVFEIDLAGNFTFVNNHALEDFGYTKEDFSNGINLFDLVEEDERERIKLNIDKLVHGEYPNDSVYKAKSRDGKKFLYEIHPNLIIRDKKIIGIRGIGIEISNQKQFELELIEAKKKAEESDRLKSAFLANMSHEIRTPLNSIVGFSYLMSERNLSEEEIKHMTKYIRTSSDHLLVLINDIIDVSKIEAGQLELNYTNVNISEILGEIRLYLEQEKVRCEKEHLDIVFKSRNNLNGLYLHTDGLRLKQILYNLINNALKFTEKGTIEYGYTSDKSKIIFYVKDSGIGVSDELGDKIFNRFIKINSNEGKLYSGFGLGLAISKQLADMLGGKLWYESNDLNGTTFFLSISKPLKN